MEDTDLELDFQKSQHEAMTHVQPSVFFERKDDDELDHTRDHEHFRYKYLTSKTTLQTNGSPLLTDLTQNMNMGQNTLRMSPQSPQNNQSAILYCRDINHLKKFWEKHRRSQNSGSSSWLQDLGIEILLPRSGYEDPSENRLQKQKRKSLSQLSQQYKPVRKIIGYIDEVCYRENGESFRDLLRKLPEEKRAQEENWIKRRKMAIEMEETKKIIKNEYKNPTMIENIESDAMISTDIELSSPTQERRSKKGKDDIQILPTNLKEEWGFTPEEAKRIYDRQEEEMKNGKKLFCRWSKIGKEVGNKTFQELPNIGERIHYILRLYYPKLIPQKHREVVANPKEEWGFDADDIKALIEQYDANPDPKKEKLSMRKIGEILGNKHRLHPEKKPFAERNDRNQLVHSLLKKKYPELAKRFERKSPVIRNSKRKLSTPPS